MRQRMCLLLLCASLGLGAPGRDLRAQEKAVQYMVIIAPQAQWLQRGAGTFLPTQLCFWATDDQEAFLTAHVQIQQKLLPHLPPEVEKQLKFTLAKDVPSEHSPFERPAS